MWRAIFVAVTIIGFALPVLAVPTTNLHILPGVALGPLNLEARIGQVRGLLPWYPSWEVNQTEKRDENGVVTTRAHMGLYRWEKRGEQSFRWDVAVFFRDGKIHFIWTDDPLWSYRGRPISEVRLGWLIGHLGDPSHIRPRSPYAIVYTWNSAGVAFRLVNEDETWTGREVWIFPRGTWDN